MAPTAVQCASHIALWLACYLPSLSSTKQQLWGVQVVKGADVVQMIEKVKTDRFDKPFEDVKMVNIEIKMSVD